MKIFIVPIFRGWTTCSSSNELVSELTALPTHTHKPRAGGAIKVFGGGGEGPAVLGLGLSLSGFQGFTSHFAGFVPQGPGANLRNRTGPPRPPEKKHNGLLR